MWTHAAQIHVFLIEDGTGLDLEGAREKSLPLTLSHTKGSEVDALS